MMNSPQAPVPLSVFLKLTSTSESCGLTESILIGGLRDQQAMHRPHIVPFTLKHKEDTGGHTQTHRDTCRINSMAPAFLHLKTTRSVNPSRFDGMGHVFPSFKVETGPFSSKMNQLGSSSSSSSSSSSAPIKVDTVTSLCIQYTVLLCAIMNTIELI